METTKCNDVHCPTHLGFKTRGRTFTGTVIEFKAQKTATVEWERRKYIPKYERYEKRRTRLKVHVPECSEVKKGDIVVIKECRPISKTKKFVITEKVAQNLTYLQKEEHLLKAKQNQEKDSQPIKLSHKSSEDKKWKH